MRVALGSDLHLDFGKFKSINKHSADLLILAGDICEVGAISVYREFFEDCSNEFCDVIYIMGNHEHYHGDFAKTSDTINEYFAKHRLSNVHFLEKSYVDLHGHRFYGGTMWTDMNRNNSLDVMLTLKHMNDYRLVKNSASQVSYRVPVTENGIKTYKFKHKSGKLHPDDTINDHNNFVNTLKKTVDESSLPVCVVSHHLPSYQSVPVIYRESVLNPAYASNLDKFILNYSHKIKLWMHGHTHDKLDYTIDQTRITCNPRGYYGYETSANGYDYLYFDI